MKITKSILKKFIKEEILKEMTGNNRFPQIRQALAAVSPIPDDFKPLNPMESEYVEAHFEKEIDDDRLQKLRLFSSGRDIRPLVNLTDIEKNYIMYMQGGSPEVRRYFSSTYPLLEFPFGAVGTIYLAWNDFVEEEKLREIPDLKEKIENHGLERGYQNRLHIGTMGSIYTGKGGDYLYDHIRENNLLPKLKAKMFDYLKRYTNPSQMPKRLTLTRGIDIR